MKNKTEHLNWKVDTPKLLIEITNNPQCGILRMPLNIFQQILLKVAERSLEINDDKLNALMLRLSLYEIPHGNKKEMDKIMKYIKKYS